MFLLTKELRERERERDCVEKSTLSQLKGWIVNSAQELGKFEISKSDKNTISMDSLGINTLQLSSKPSPPMTKSLSQQDRCHILCHQGGPVLTIFLLMAFL